MRKTVSLIFMIFILLFSCKEDVDPLNSNQHELVDELNSMIKPFSGSGPSLPPADLSSLDFLAKAKIVGLGEGSHGAKEFFEMKHRIFQYMVEKFGFKAFGFEMDFAEAIIFDDYIQGKRNDDLRKLMTSKMLFWTWKTEEVRTLFEWMRTYNQGKSESDRIHLYGIDCQFPTYNADFLTERIEKVDLVLSAWVQSKLSVYKNLSIAGDSTNYKVLVKNVGDVYSEIVSRKDDLIGRGLSNREYEIVKQLARTIVQTHDELYRLKIADNKINYRDFYMAENARWISDFVGPDKICLWAHNVHISGSADLKRMGYYLADVLNDQYKKVGFTFSNGTFNAVGFSNGAFTGVQEFSIDSRPLSSTINYLLNHANASDFVLNIDDLPGASDLSRYFNQRHGLLTTYATYYGDPKDVYTNTNLVDSFDVLIYFNDIHHSQFLK